MVVHLTSGSSSINPVLSDIKYSSNTGIRVIVLKAQGTSISSVLQGPFELTLEVAVSEDLYYSFSKTMRGQAISRFAAV